MPVADLNCPEYQHRDSHPVDKSNDLKCDPTIILTGINSATDYPQPLRRINYRDTETAKTFNFLTNNFVVLVQTVADLYRNRWQVEFFFKWNKQPRSKLRGIKPKEIKQGRTTSHGSCF